MFTHPAKAPMIRTCTIAAALLAAGCAAAPTDPAYFAGAARDLNSPEMTARICAAGADTPACRPGHTPATYRRT